MITKLSMKNFCAFKELGIKFSPKVNIIIGENSSGKTQLLKAAYVLSTVGTDIGDERKITKPNVEQAITDKLIQTYKPSNGKIGGLHHRGGDGEAEITVEFSPDSQLGAKFAARSKTARVTGNYQKPFDQGAAYIPTKEVLSFLDGISSDASDPDTLCRLFDSTYFHLTEKLLDQKHDPGDVEEKTIWFREEITNELGGRFVFDGTTVYFKEGRYKDYKSKHASKSYFAPSSKHKLSTTMTAEGYRKIGVLQRLLENQAIGTGVNGPLFWDEPESNMNPKLMRLLVKIILDLSRNGQQIVIATHDYVLLKWFDLLVDKGKSDDIQYHSLYRNDESQQLEINSTGEYLNIDPNSIDDTFESLINSDLEKSMGNLGR